MGKKQRKRAQSVSNETNNLALNVRRTAVSLAVAAALPGAMMAPVAMAQDANDEEEVIEEIITTGYRSSLMNAIATKRDATSIVESISAEDIGKLPDASIGESLARLALRHSVSTVAPTRFRFAAWRRTSRPRP